VLEATPVPVTGALPTYGGGPRPRSGETYHDSNPARG
jgi:hypothetical protein